MNIIDLLALTAVPLFHPVVPQHVEDIFINGVNPAAFDAETMQAWLYIRAWDAGVRFHWHLHLFAVGEEWRG